MKIETTEKKGDDSPLKWGEPRMELGAKGHTYWEWRICSFLSWVGLFTKSSARTGISSMGITNEVDGQIECVILGERERGPSPAIWLTCPRTVSHSAAVWGLVNTHWILYHRECLFFALKVKWTHQLFAVYLKKKIKAQPSPTRPIALLWDSVLMYSLIVWAFFFKVHRS